MAFLAYSLRRYEYAHRLWPRLMIPRTSVSASATVVAVHAASSILICCASVGCSFHLVIPPAAATCLGSESGRGSSEAGEASLSLGGHFVGNESVRSCSETVALRGLSSPGAAEDWIGLERHWDELFKRMAVVVVVLESLREP